MSENLQEAAPLVSAAPPELQEQAKQEGWIPPDRYKGDPERFIDAEEFLKRGETILPIVKRTNETLRRDLISTRDQLRALQEEMQELRRRNEEADERHAVELNRRIEEAKIETRRQLAEAHKEGDHAGAAELTEKLIELNAMPEHKVPEKKAEVTPQPLAVDPVMLAWQAENDWFGKDKRKTALALGVAEELRANGEQSVGAEFLTKVKEEVDAMFAPATPPASKVESARNGSGGSEASGGKGYNSLPAEAKAACDADAKRFVGEGKKYKTLADWRSRYAQIYFEKE